MDITTLAAARKYTDNSIAGTSGALAGKNCTIDSITDITGGHRVTFKWTSSSGTSQTDTMDVMDGSDGNDGVSPSVSVTDITGGHKVTITDSTGDHEFNVMDGATGATGAQGPAGQGVASGGTTGQILKKKSNTNYDTEWADDQDISGLASKVSGATEGHLASLTSGGDLADSGKSVEDFQEKLGALATTELTIYVDYANGNDDNDGLTDLTPIKTFDFLAIKRKYPLYPRITVLFMSDYTGDITVENTECIIFKSKDVTASTWTTANYTVNGKFILNNINEVFLQFLNIASVGTGAATDIYIQNCGVAYTGYLKVTNSSGATTNGRDIRVAKCANYIFRDIILNNQSTGNRYGFSFESSNVFAFGKPNSTKMTNITFGFDTYPSGRSENSQLTIPRDVFFTCGANQIMGPDFKGIVVMDGSVYSTVGDSTSSTGKYYYEGRKINLMPRYDFRSAEGMDGKSLKKPTGITGSFQGLAIWNDIWIQLFNGGNWAMYDMNNPDNGNSFASGALGSAGVDNHCNNLTFGKMYDAGDPFPLLYVTGWIDDIETGGTGSCCYVERLQSDGSDGYTSTLLQTITIDYTDFASSGYEVPYPYLNFMCDIDNGYLYTFSAKYRTNGSQSQYDNVNRYYITRFKIPDLANATVTLTADDVLQQFILPYDVDFTQGGTIYNNQMFCMFGDGNNTTHQNALRVYDLLEGCEVSKVDLSQTIWKAREPEDVHIYQGYLYTLTQNGYVRKLTF